MTIGHPWPSLPKSQSVLEYRMVSYVTGLQQEGIFSECKIASTYLLFQVRDFHKADKMTIKEMMEIMVDIEEENI